MQNPSLFKYSKFPSLFSLYKATLLTSLSSLYKATLLTSLFSLLLTSCSSTKYIPQIVEHSAHDTLYISNIQYDSIYIDKYHSIDRGRDTTFVIDSQVEYRYKLLRDTLRLVRIDSIPIIKEVTVSKEVKYVPWYYKFLAIAGATAILLLILIFTRRS